MYDDIRDCIFKKQLRPYIIQLVIFYTATFITTGIDGSILTNGGSAHAVNLVFLFLNLLMSIYQLYKCLKFSDEDSQGRKKQLKNSTWYRMCLFNNIVNILFCLIVVIRSLVDDNGFNDFIR